MMTVTLCIVLFAALISLVYLIVDCARIVIRFTRQFRDETTPDLRVLHADWYAFYRSDLPVWAEWWAKLEMNLIRREIRRRES